MLNLDFLSKYKSKIEKSRKKMEDAWNFNKQKVPPTMVWFPPFYNLEESFMMGYDEYYLKRESSLEIQLKSIESHLKNIDDNFIPSLDTFLGVGLIPSSFGTKIKYFKDKDPWVEGQVINDIKDIDKIKKPNPKKDGLTKVVLELIDFYKSKVGEKIPISIPESNGPACIAADLMGTSNFFINLYSDPKRIHKLLQIITEFMVDFLNILLPRIETSEGLYEWSGIYYPKGKGGIRIGDDFIQSISKDMYVEFLKPYDEILLKEAKGGLVHWCGEGSNNFENILGLKNITGAHNVSLGDADLIKNQVKRLSEMNNSKKDKIVYFNSLYLPASKDYANIIMDAVKDS